MVLIFSSQLWMRKGISIFPKWTDIKRAGKTHRQEDTVYPYFSPSFEKLWGRITDETDNRKRRWGSQKKDTSDERGQREQGPHWKTLSRLLLLALSEVSLLHLKNAFRWKTKLTESQKQSWRRWKKQLLDVIRVSHSCLHGRGQNNHLFSHLNKLFKFTALYATQGLSGVCTVLAKWGRTTLWVLKCLQAPYRVANVYILDKLFQASDSFKGKLHLPVLQ